MNNLSLISKINKYEDNDFIEHFDESNDIEIEIEQDNEFKERCYNVIFIIFTLLLIFFITKNE